MQKVVLFVICSLLVFGCQSNNQRNISEEFAEDSPKVLQPGVHYQWRGLTNKQLARIEKAIDSNFRSKNHLFPEQEITDFTYNFITKNTDPLEVEIEATCGKFWTKKQWDSAQIQAMSNSNCFYRMKYIFRANRIDSFEIKNRPFFSH